MSTIFYYLFILLCLAAQYVCVKLFKSMPSKLKTVCLFIMYLFIILNFLIITFYLHWKSSPKLIDTTWFILTLILGLFVLGFFACVHFLKKATLDKKEILRYFCVTLLLIAIINKGSLCPWKAIFESSWKLAAVCGGMIVNLVCLKYLQFKMIDFIPLPYLSSKNLYSAFSPQLGMMYENSVLKKMDTVYNKDGDTNENKTILDNLWSVKFYTKIATFGLGLPSSWLFTILFILFVWALEFIPFFLLIYFNIIPHNLHSWKTVLFLILIMLYTAIYIYRIIKKAKKQSNGNNYETIIQDHIRSSVVANCFSKKQGLIVVIDLLLKIILAIIPFIIVFVLIFLVTFLGLSGGNILLSLTFYEKLFKKNIPNDWYCNLLYLIVFTGIFYVFGNETYKIIEIWIDGKNSNPNLRSVIWNYLFAKGFTNIKKPANLVNMDFIKQFPQYTGLSKCSISDACDQKKAKPGSESLFDAIKKPYGTEVYISSISNKEINPVRLFFTLIIVGSMAAATSIGGVGYFERLRTFILSITGVEGFTTQTLPSSSIPKQKSKPKSKPKQKSKPKPKPKQKSKPTPKPKQIHTHNPKQKPNPSSSKLFRRKEVTK